MQSINLVAHRITPIRTIEIVRRKLAQLKMPFCRMLHPFCRLDHIYKYIQFYTFYTKRVVGYVRFACDTKIFEICHIARDSENKKGVTIRMFDAKVRNGHCIRTLNASH